MSDADLVAAFEKTVRSLPPDRWWWSVDEMEGGLARFLSDPRTAAALARALAPYELPDPWTEGLRSIAMVGTAEEVASAILAELMSRKTDNNADIVHQNNITTEAGKRLQRWHRGDTPHMTDPDFDAAIASIEAEAREQRVRDDRGEGFRAGYGEAVAAERARLAETVREILAALDAPLDWDRESPEDRLDRFVSDVRDFLALLEADHA